MLGTIFFHITVIRTFVLSISMALAFMFTVGRTLALVLSIGMTLALLTFSVLALVLAGSLALAFMLAVGCALALVLSIGMTLALLTFCVLAFVLAGSLALAFMLAIGMALALVLRSGGIGCMATGSAILATSGQLLASCRIGLHSICIITQFADILAQHVGVCLLGIVIDRDFRRIGIIRVIFHTLEERDVVFETVNAFLAFEGSIGLDGNTLHLCVCTQCHYGHQGHQDKFFHFYCFIDY